ncbi:putative pentatricopeptide repeat-containing protein [Acorus calamus]|uniref:Pentatricopeptide repeat-containing protein n=1 Tax=Acorus calamus TaxID=4465 RepID=A0AAV9EYQ2_ACOCL|nr:putative pentatricopeptide repeat-containing protein [Acorus calamus]
MALMTSHLSSGDPESSLMAFRSLGSSPGIAHNEFTLSAALKCCGVSGDVGRGSQVHAACVKSGFESQPFVGNSIIAMYSKCGSIGDSVRVFDAMRERRSLVSWNAMIAGYVNAGCSRKAVLVFAEMWRNCETPDEFTLSSVFKGCGAAGDFAEGKQIHAYVVVSGFPISLKTSVASALIDFYVKCGRLVEARRVFDRTVVKNEVSWTAMMAGYVQEGCLYEAMDLFRELRKVETIVDGFVLSSLAGVFADLALIVQGKQIHAYTTKISCVLDVSVANSIVDMYLKCGLTDDAMKRFEEIASKNVVSWTVMITGYGKHGHAREAIHLFEAMRLEMIDPDEVAYLAVLSACSHAGLVKESREYFERLRRDSRVQPKVEHYACMVDVLGRAGRLEEAKSLIEDMPVEANVGIWQTLLSACRVHKDLKMGREVGGILMELDEGNAVNYVMVSNIYAEAGEWGECERIRGLMRRRGLKKDGGRSWIEIKKEVHNFYGGDDSHPLMGRIREALMDVERRMREEVGYVSRTGFAMHDIEEESKEDNLRMHSERLAVGLALACGGSSPEIRDVIRVFKNLRVCGLP